MALRIGSAILCRILAAALFVACGRADARTASRASDRIAVIYDAPDDPTHGEIYREARQHNLLERIGAIASLVRLPARLTYRLKECGGRPNAWYEPATHTITVCYELMAGIVSLGPKVASPRGVTRDQAIRGPIVQILLHETSHAFFDLLHVPLFGREEDAADQLASLLLLHLAPANARDVLDGSAYFFAALGRQEPVNEGSFAGTHGLSWQRFFNLLCLAYGSDPQRFGNAVDKGVLPQDRAKTCRDEYAQVAYAFAKLIAPHLRRRPAGGAWLQRAFRTTR